MMTQDNNMEPLHTGKPSIWQRFRSDCAKRNPVTDIILYGIQAAAVLYSLVMIAEIIDMICDFRDPSPISLYEDLTVSGLIFRMFSKGWLVGLAVCIVVFICNLRVIRWKADGALWLFIFFFVISIPAMAVEDEMFLYFSVFSLGSLAFYFLALFLPKKIADANLTTFRQCRKPENGLITISFLILLLWSVLLGCIAL